MNTHLCLGAIVWSNPDIEDDTLIHFCVLRYAKLLDNKTKIQKIIGRVFLFLFTFNKVDKITKQGQV